MAIPRGHRFTIESDRAFPQGLVLIGEVVPDNECQTREIIFVAEVQPVPTTTEVLPGMRPSELDGLTAEPRVAGNGEFKYQSHLYRATGFTATTSASGTRPAPSTKPARQCRSRCVVQQGRVNPAMNAGEPARVGDMGRAAQPMSPSQRGAPRFGC
jgi:hypothetical protein